jgi:hypothetical protein
MDKPKFRKLEEVWDQLENEDKDLISAGLEKLLNPKKTIYVDPASTLRLNDLFTFTVHNF